MKFPEISKNLLGVIRVGSQRPLKRASVARGKNNTDVSQAIVFANAVKQNTCFTEILVVFFGQSALREDRTSSVADCDHSSVVPSNRAPHKVEASVIN